MEMEDESRISNMNALLFALALEMGLLQMRILEGSTELRALQLKASHSSDQLKLAKLQKDREMVKGVLRRTLMDLARRGEWSSLHLAVVSLDQGASSVLSKRLHHERLVNTFEEITIELKTKKNQWAVDLRNADQRVAFLRDKMKDDLLNANTRLVFAEKWLSARAESLELRRRPSGARDVHRAGHEQRVHQEVVKTFVLQSKEHEAAIARWQVRHAADTARIDEHLAYQRQQLQVMIARREELQKLYDLHEGETRAWLSFKRQRAERLAREERARAAATRVQAWWRGVMVRRAFGPFRYLRTIKKSPTKSKKK